MRMFKELVMSLVMAAMLLGCSSTSFERNKNTSELVVTYAVLKVIENTSVDSREERKGRILSIATDVQAQAAGTGEVSLESLKGEVQKRLSKDLSPADRYLIDKVIDAAVAELQIRVGNGVLSPDQKYQVSEVLQWVIDATKF